MAKLHFGNTIFVSDPCYRTDTWCTEKVENVLPGEYLYNIEVVDTGEFGERVSFLQVCHKDYATRIPKWECMSRDIGVDSGQAGFFDYKAFAAQGRDEKKHDAFYRECCGLTDDFGYALEDGTGIVSSSGYGDGCYDLYGARNEDGKIYALRLDFQIGDCEDED